MAPRTDYAAVDAWGPIVRELVGRGVNDVPLLVFTLAYRVFELASGEAVASHERLMRAMSTVAAALDCPVAHVEHLVVPEAANPATEPALRARCYAIADKLDDLPGVKLVGPLNFGPHALTVAFKRLAFARNIPLPKLAEPSTDWLALLRALTAAGVADEAVLALAPAFNRVTLRSGRVVEPIAGDVRDETLAALSGTSAAATTMRVEHAIAFRISEVQAIRERGTKELAALPAVAGVEAARAPSPKLEQPRYDGQPVAPPWTAFPEPPESLRWRMGPGEDYIDQWWWFFGQLSAPDQVTYFAQNPPPPHWADWVRRVLENAKS